MNRCVKILNLLLCFTLSVNHVPAQDSETLSFYYNPVQSNPALAGSEGPGILRLIYRDYYPGKGLNLYSINCSYDSFIESIHGGVGLFVSENVLGDLINDLRAGAAYSYHLRASRDLYVNAGFMASLIHRSLDAGKVVLPDQIDPLMGPVLPAGEIIASGSRTTFDAGVGFLLSYRAYHAGISVNHIFKPDITGKGQEGSRLGRRLSVHGASTFRGANDEVNISPGFVISTQYDNLIGALGTSIGYKNLSFNILPFFDLRSGLSYVQSGFQIKAGKIELAYNYNFAPFRTDRLLPFTLSNQVYVSIGLYNVEKRGLINTINYPKM
ncbi:MAG: PorP/SprF family type IX secretion system membrane protein [Bacteroidales bacterium]|nr:PorP/SprF family type IX secretion system membrane protein [Bacteroidales bacterium]